MVDYDRPTWERRKTNFMAQGDQASLAYRLGMERDPIESVSAPREAKVTENLTAFTNIWTHTAPTQAGWYWRWDGTTDNSPHVVRVVQRGQYFYYEETDVRLFTRGWWAGPIPEPMDH